MRDCLTPPATALPSRVACFPGAVPAALPLAPSSSRANFIRLLGLAPHEDVYGALTAGIADCALHALAVLMPHLVCGEESATIVFSIFRQQAAGGTGLEAEHATRIWAGIAADEAVHDYMLSHMVRALAADSLPGAARNKRAASLFFLRLKSDDALTHFARIAALDSFVSRVLAALQHRHSALYEQGPLMRMLSRIRHDEGRHVSLTRHYLLERNVPLARLRYERAWVADRFQAFLTPYLPAFDALRVDPDRLFKCLH